MSIPPLQALPMDELRQRSSSKWRTHPADVLPLFVAETDFPLAPLITDVLERAVRLGDTGYTPVDSGIREAYVDFARRRFDWSIQADRVRNTSDVLTGIVELLRTIIDPGDRVVVTPPVYPPFYLCVPDAGGVVESVPLVQTAKGFALDLAGLEAAFAGGARALLLCSPHNPTGTVFSREELAAVADLADRYGAVVISDEIHAPLTQPDTTFIPFLAASDTAAEVGLTVASASKAYNLAGLKCAVIVAASERAAEVLHALPPQIEWRTGLFGALAGVAAFAPESDAWLDSLLAALDDNRRLLAELLSTHLPEAKFDIPDAGYLAWVDLTAVGWGDDPAAKILAEARVALNPGPSFGPQGAGHVRINFGCAPETLTEAVERIGALARP